MNVNEKISYWSLKLVGIIVLVYIIQIMVSGFTNLFVLNQSSFSEPWRFVSAIFLHGSFGHLISNMFALALFGIILESVIGSKRFLGVFFVTGILASLISVNLYNSSLGASGAIFGVLGTLVVLRPFMMVWAAGLPMPMFVAGIFWVLIDLMGIFNSSSNVANFAHLSGMFFGIIFGIIYRLGNKNRDRNEKIVLDEQSMRNWEDHHIRGARY